MSEIYKRCEICHNVMIGIMIISYAREIGNITEISDADKLYEHNVILCLKEEMRCIGVSLFCRTMGDYQLT